MRHDQYYYPALTVFPCGKVPYPLFLPYPWLSPVCGGYPQLVIRTCIRTARKSFVRTAGIKHQCPKNRYPATLVPRPAATKPTYMHTCG